MPAATPTRQVTPGGIELERWQRIPPKDRWDAGKNYAVKAPHDCTARRCEKPHEPFSGTSAHQTFRLGEARVEALDESATDAQIEQRLADLDWLANNGYSIRFAGRYVEYEEEAS